MEHYEKWEQAGNQGLWSGLIEDEEGRLRDTTTEEDDDAKKKRGKRRIEKEEEEEESVARGLIRSLVCILDASKTAGKNDIKPNRFGAGAKGVREFVSKFLKANPISTLSLIVANEGGASRITRLSSSISMHTQALDSLIHRPRFPPRGTFSLVAAIEEALHQLRNTPDYGYREILIIVSSFGSLDASDLRQSLAECNELNIRISFISLVAETFIFKQVAQESAGSYGVALDRNHLLKLLDTYLPPPKLTSLEHALTKDSELPDLVHMGFPSLKVDSDRAGMAISSLDHHPEWTSTTYSCPRCATRVPTVPIDCPVCELPLVASTHLAAYYHHLFPVPRFIENAQTRDEAPANCTTAHEEYDRERNNKNICYGCFDPLPHDDPDACTYTCPRCSTTFCATCDDFIHDVLHVCPGCDSSAAASSYAPSSSDSLSVVDSKGSCNNGSTPALPIKRKAMTNTSSAASNKKLKFIASLPHINEQHAAHS